MSKENNHRMQTQSITLEVNLRIIPDGNHNGQLTVAESGLFYKNVSNLNQVKPLGNLFCWIRIRIIFYGSASTVVQSSIRIRIHKKIKRNRRIQVHNIGNRYTTVIFPKPRNFGSEILLYCARVEIKYLYLSVISEGNKSVS